jgi:hypothetical protein
VPVAPASVPVRWSAKLSQTRHASGRPVGSGDAILLAMLAVVLALMLSAGSRNPAALLLLGIAAALLVASRSMVPSEPSRATWLASIGCCALSFFFNVDLFGGLEVLFAAVLVAGVVVALRWHFRVGTAVVAVSSIAASVAPWHWGVGLFDVYHLEMAAAVRLLHGGNPYSATIIDRVPISPGVDVIGPEHLPYGPVVALGSLPGALVGDLRVASVLWAIAAAAVVLLVARGGGLSTGSKRMLLLLTVASPLIPSMVVTAWPETLIVATFGLSIALHRRHPVWMVVAIAACLLVKPTALVLFFPFFVWSPSWRLRILAGSLVALGVMLVFSIGVGVPAIVFDTLIRHIWQPPRYDGLTVGASVFVMGWGPMPSWVFPAVVVAACVVILRRRPRGTSDLCVAAAFLFLVSTAFASYAFFNFYYVVAGVLLLAVASVGISPGRVSLPFGRGKPEREPEEIPASVAAVPS